MSGADTAFELAQKRIAEAAETGADRLDFAKIDFRALEHIPAEIAALAGLKTLNLSSTQITNLAPLAGLAALQSLWLNSTQITDLAPLAGLAGLQDLTLSGSRVADLRPIVGLDKLGTDGRPGLTFADTPATARDARLAELAQIEDHEQRARGTLAYLRSLPPLVDAAQQLSDALPLEEEIVQDPETGTFDVRPRPVAKPDLYTVTLAQVANALKDVLANPKNGLRADEAIVRRIRRTLDRYANDPQYVEMELTTANASLLRQLASGDLPPSEENQHLQMVVQQTTQGIRAAHPAIDLNRRMLQEQALREMPREARQAVAELGPLFEAITTGELQAQMREDVAELSNPTEMPPPEPPPQKPPAYPRLGGASRDPSLQPPSPETVRVIGRTTRIMIALRKGAKRVAIGGTGGTITYLAVEVLETLMSFFTRIYNWIAPLL